MNFYRVKPLLREINCGKYKCQEESGATNTSGADMVIFHDIDVNHFNSPPWKDINSLWAFVAKEPQMKLSAPEHLWNGVFNYSVTFDSDTDGNMFVFRSKILKLFSIQNNNFATKRLNRIPRALWLVSHCNKETTMTLASGREEYAVELSKHFQVDVYTSRMSCQYRLGDLVKDVRGDRQPEIGDYAFYLSFENNLCKDYISEKLWKVLEANVTTIPIVLGGLTIKEYTRVAPLNSFIHVRNFSSPRKLAEHLRYVSNNDDAFNYYQQWRNEFYLTHTRGHYANIGGELLFIIRSLFDP
ncbi:glycoprotein 3-alpha-L-fucosyltransferase A-like [Watersipora subatra]|uniref:glycoprotein 3-alpha-L-fucosyltransferase A-like n=1 Tax=Watersipora subatra TaxID=2589382 RepID=UPI00355B1CA1